MTPVEQQVAAMVTDAQRELRRARSAFEATLSEVVDLDNLTGRLLSRYFDDPAWTADAEAEVFGVLEVACVAHPDLAERTRRVAAASVALEVAEVLAEEVAAGTVEALHDGAGQLAFRKAVT